MRRRGGNMKLKQTQQKQTHTLNTRWPKQNKEAVLCTCKLLQYRQLPDKNSRDTSKWYLKIIHGTSEIFIYIIHDFFPKPQRYFSEFWFGNTGLIELSTPQHPCALLFTDCIKMALSGSAFCHDYWQCFLPWTG